MKIAIVAPSPVPFTIGGIENLAWGLTESINHNTTNQAELIKLPSKENNFWDLIDTYKSFYNLKLDHFDKIITLKYPAWMVRHDNHICYMTHRLRGLYDTYHFTKLPILVDNKNKYINNILSVIEDYKGNKLDNFFESIEELYSNRSKVDTHYFNFPGPFIRNIIHFMDNYALSENSIKGFYCISDTVKNRKEYFPNNIKPITVYPPSFLKDYNSKSYKNIFTVSRLDSPKRISLLIQAMQYIKNDINLIIAGTGPDEQNLKTLAGNDKRIKFVGYVNNDDVCDYYANSLCVPYVPYEEDYGLITIEAMMHKKPVITCLDSGGPNEFVKNNITGFSVKADPVEIAKKIQYLLDNNEEAVRLGNNAFEAVKDITWKNAVKKLLGIDNPKTKKKKIVVTVTFPIYPPRGGGQARIYNLCKNLTKDYDVTIVSFCNYGESYFEGYIAQGLYEIRVPKSKLHQEKEWEMEQIVGIPISDIAMPKLSQYTPKYAEKLKPLVNECDIIILSHPYLLHEVKNISNNKPIVYEAQDIEYKIKKSMLPDTKITAQLLDEICAIEKSCCEASKFIYTCSIEDKISLCEMYNISKEIVVVVPNGVDSEYTRFSDVENRQKVKLKLGLNNQKIGLFMGSWHEPNLQACKEIFSIALKDQKIKYLLMGSQCLFFKDKKIPSNVGLLGILSEEDKQKVFDIVDFALNPMLSGSGTNLKIFDYMAAGIPVITTEFGARGIEDKDNLIICDINNMYDIIKDLKLDDYKQKTNNARQYIENVFDWKIISRILLKKLNEL